MLKLMKLEWKKHHLSRYLKGVAICIISIFTVVGLMAWGSQGESERMFPDYDGFMSLTNIFIRITFITFSAVILSRLVIDEYRSKTMHLMFSYPLPRKRIMQAKLSIVFIFCFFSIVMATLIISMLTFFLNPTIGFFEVPVQIDDIIATIPSALLNACMTAGISLIPLYFGMRKHSAPTTITTAVLIGFFINATVSDGGSTASLYEFIGVPIAFCFIGLTIAYFSYRKVEKVDVV